ncbi:hypothetical protein GCG54_00000505 [Colletotrichum gloeosporioides]|uniref:Hypervirulence associated protein TUDOR domain-containing protein n=1 Tax=Colletotrichum gloeosporioides TaxID=474922 RepID=A0A8H4FJH8_COLGL|nr:uncharacterized protein GCG54_00000505 [Colletotrichum gloeosporioides]KAF3804156.1 hypothetical protein GCG54_00000505 [Colletotrichum gloeosporioides]
MKGKEEVISEFNEYVNMTAEELESWLKSGDSNSAGWPKDDAEGDGETVGHDSGRNIVEILKANPDKKEDEYTDEQVEHMRKVVAYWFSKRHLAQEAKGNSEKSPEEVKKTKSYASLKNWGHDFLKAQGKEGGEQNGKSAKSKNGDEEKAESNGSKKEKNGSKKEDDEEEAEEEVEKVDEGQEEEEEEADEEKTGDKRKKSGEENGSNKKRQTRQGEGKTTKKGEDGEDEKEEEEEDDGDEEMEDDEEEGDDKENGSSKKTKKGPKKGDKVSWQWGNGNPEGKVLDVKEEKTTIETKNGNEVSRDGNPDDPAVVLDTGKSKAIKANHELN